MNNPVHIKVKVVNLWYLEDVKVQHIKQQEKSHEKGLVFNTATAKRVRIALNFSPSTFPLSLFF